MLPEPVPGRLILAATPIGDPEDAPPRLVRLLAEVDVVAAEDTRRLRRLATALGVTPRGRVLSYHDHNERERGDELVAAVAGGATVLVVTDAGMPSVSDPGLRVVRAAVRAGLPVTAVPGPSAVLTALALSGLATDRFCFEGFLPRRAGERDRALSGLAGEARTLVFFESAQRLAVTLAAMGERFGPDRPAAVCRELTKTHEEVRRGTLAELAAWATGPVLGEVTLVVGGCPPVQAGPEDLPALVAQVRARVAAGERVKRAVAEVAGAAGASKRDLYAAVHRPDPDPDPDPDRDPDPAP
ncbi:MAG: 16S rRNA (cytidine(1402)-2'-O)-methyltransferase [Kineosporiaceae bacterium]